MAIHIRIQYHFSNFFWLLACGPFTVASWSPSATFYPGSNLLLRHCKI